MNLAIKYPLQQENPFMKVVRNEERIFKIRYLQELNLIAISGWSITKDIHTKYGKLLEDIKSHFETSNRLNLHLKYELFNSSSLKYIFRIVKVLNKAFNDGNDVNVYWRCDSENDSEVIDLGIDLAKFCDFKFEISCQ